MTHPPDSPPPSDELSWELFETLTKVFNLRDLVQLERNWWLLCRTIRSLCAERDARLDEAARLLAAVTIRDAQLSAYVAAAEGRPASELVAPSEVVKVIEERDAARADRDLFVESREAMAVLTNQQQAQLAERDAEIERYKVNHYMPGAWVCDKCGFGLYKRVLAMSVGEVFVDNADVDERCPNDGQQMRRKTWKEVCAQQEKYIDTLRPPRAEIES